MHCTVGERDSSLYTDNHRCYHGSVAMHMPLASRVNVTRAQELQDV